MMPHKDYRFWEKVLIKELALLWKKSVKFLPCHGPDHHWRIWKMAKPFGLKKKADMEILVASCLLHDVYCFNLGNPQNHAAGSASIARKILKKVGFPKEKIELVAAAIDGHRSRTKSPKNLESKILKTFDKLDAFGPIGVYRIIAPLSIRKYDASDIAAWAIFQKRLDKKWQSIAFPEIKKKYLRSFLYSKKYFNDLAASLALRKNKKSKFTETKVYSPN